MVLAFAVTSCASRKRKEDVSGFKKFYHSFTSKYNGYFNANELLEESIATLEAAHQDNYNQILPVYTVVDVDNPKMVAENLDLAIEKVTRVATIHEVGNYVDDCYVLMGQAQYLKQDYETAQETMEYFEQEFNPSNPYGSNYQKKKPSKKAVKKEREAAKQNQKKLEEEAKKAKEEARKEKREAEDKAREEAKKAKEKEREEAKKAREEKAKQDKKERDARKKASKKTRGKKRSKKEDTTKEDSTKDESNQTESETEPETQDENVNQELKESVSNEVVGNNTSNKVAEDTGTPETEIEDEEYIPPVKPEAKEDDTAYSDGMLWLSRIYIEREKYSNAEYLLRKLSQSSVNDNVKRGIAPAKAHLYLKQKDYDKAIPELEAAIESSNDGKLKARYAYIIAQLYQRKGDYANALDAFEKVKKHKGDFRMDFNADLSIAKNGLLAGRETESQAFDKINKMLDEAKYAEFKDQVYYTLGEIALAQGNDAQALKNFTLSIRNNNGNIPLKTEAYYNMAKLNFDKEAYVDAKYYYDSTLMTMTKVDERHLVVTNYAKNLSGIAKNIETIALQDSLLALASLSEEELRKIGEKLVMEQREADKNSKINETSGADKKGAGLFTTGGQTNRTRGFGTSSFFAYNLQSKENGIREFGKRWGDRKLEDNWRRRESQSFNTFDDEGTKIEEEDLEITDAEIQRALADIPTSPASVEKANKKIEEALYQLGVSFRGSVKNYNRSIQALEQMVKRYPQSEKILDAYYYLYLSYTDIGNSAKANEYRNIIIEQFPDSKFAKSLKDPNYLKTLEDENNSVELYYSNTYELFEQGEYQSVKNRIQQSQTLFGPENTLKAKFGLLNAMVIGNETGKDGYVKALQDVITRYPNTPEQTRAREIMRFLKGDSTAFDVVDIKTVDDDFDFEEDKLHYVAIVLYQAEPEKFTDAKINISNFNKKYYKTKKLQLSDIFLSKDDNSQIILVRKFKDMKEAMEYYETVEKNKADYIKENTTSYDVLPVTQANYRKMISERSAVKYRLFFEKKYLTK